MSAPQATLLAALLAAIPSSITGVAAYRNAPTRDEVAQRTTARIQTQVLLRPGYKRVLFERIGLGLLVPMAWSIDDAAYAFGGSDIDLIRHYDEKTNSIAEGVKFTIRAVQGNYVNAPQIEVNNQLDVFRKFDPEARVERAAIGGHDATVFSYRQSTGQRTALVHRYWLRLANRIKLDIISFTNLGESRADFESEVRDILNSVVLDSDTIQRNSRAIAR